MSTLGIRIVYSGNNSSAGHMYVVLKDNVGNVVTYGFYPEQSRFYDLGEARRDYDYREHETKVGNPGQNGVPDKAYDFYISDSAFAAALAYAEDAVGQRGAFDQKWGEYNAFNNSCVDFAWSMLTQANLAPTGMEGSVLPQFNDPDIANLYYKYYLIKKEENR